MHRRGSIYEIVKPNGYQQITNVAAAIGLTVPAGSTCALIQAESQAVRYRDDGTNPTSSVGIRLDVGDTVLYTGDLNTIKFIEEAASAKLNILYYL